MHPRQVPNIKDVQSLSMAEITTELARLQRLAGSNRLSAADLAQGTITVSNIGTIGGKYATPLVTAREVAIVALGRCAIRAVHKQNGASARMLSCSLQSW